MKYKDSKGRLVTVNNIDNNMATLNNGERVAVSRLSDKRYYTPADDTTNINTPSSSPSTNNVNESVSPDILNDESRYKNILENMGSGQKQSSEYSYNISIGEEGHVDSSNNYGNQRWNANSEVKMSNDVVERRNPVQQTKKEQPIQKASTPLPASNEEELLQKYNYPTPKKGQDDKLKELAYGENAKNIESDNQPRQPNQLQSQLQHKEENAVHKMFDKAKKVHPLKVDLKINEKIPSKDIIKMMEENFDESAIEYYAKDIFRKLMEDPSIIENQVKSSIEKYVNGTTRKKRTPKKKTNKDDK